MRTTTGRPLGHDRGIDVVGDVLHIALTPAVFGLLALALRGLGRR
ncbi:hypothetical protein [Geodermatophilus sp. FMUSA9-8]